MIREVQPDLIAAKRRQQVAWAAGDYGIIGTALDLVGEQLCEAVDVRSSEQVLDVATGNGNAALAPPAAGATSQLSTTYQRSSKRDGHGPPEIASH